MWHVRCLWRIRSEEVGIPAKSGISGDIMAVSPGSMGIGVIARVASICPNFLLLELR